MRVTRIQNLAHVVTVDDDFTILADATIEITDGVISALHPHLHPETQLRVTQKLIFRWWTGEANWPCQGWSTCTRTCR